ncbi:hypothetical protein QN388_25130, partial [Pseudomonas sp. 5B4]|nr:hypothetical protein [Pseudomonas sp. 5B4]
PPPPPPPPPPPFFFIPPPPPPAMCIRDRTQGVVLSLAGNFTLFAWVSVLSRTRVSEHWQAGPVSYTHL